MTPCNRATKRPTHVFLHQNRLLITALRGIRTLIKEAMAKPTKCSKLVMGPLDCVGINNALIHG